MSRRGKYVFNHVDPFCHFHLTPYIRAYILAESAAIVSLSPTTAPSIRSEEVIVPKNDVDVIKRAYDCFNTRNIDGVLALLAEDVAWANGMDGGHVHGHKAVRDYWTRQWALVSPHV